MSLLDDVDPSIGDRLLLCIDHLDRDVPLSVLLDTGGKAFLHLWVLPSRCVRMPHLIKRKGWFRGFGLPHSDLDYGPYEGPDHNPQ